jgi:hypothetical protein
MPDEIKKTSPERDAKKSPQPAPEKEKKQEAVQDKRADEKSALAQEAERLQTAATHKPPADMTEKLSAAERAGLPGALGLAFGADPGAARFYRKLPLSLGTANLPAETPRWRIELEGIGPGVEPLGLDILGDAVLGRGRVGNQPVDLDLDPYGGLEQGVSRRHALLRPTANHLYIIDLGSTNGTMHNGLPLGPGITRSLKHNDSVTLGRLSFNIKIVDGPALHKAPPLPSIEPDSEPTRPLPPGTAPAATSPTADTRTKFPKITQPMIDARREQLEKEGKDDTPRETKVSKATDPLTDKPADKPADKPPDTPSKPV